MRVSYMMDLRFDPSQEPLRGRLESAGTIQTRGGAGERSPRSGGLVDVRLRNSVGISQAEILKDRDMLFEKA